MKKKLKKALIAGAAAAALGAARNKSLLAGTEDGKGGIDTIVKAKQAMTSDAAYSPAKAMKKKNLFKKLLNMGPGKNATSEMGGTLANPILGAQKNNKGMRYDGMEMLIGGAKYGKMIKANQGTYVKASCKMGRNKPTKIT